MLVKYIVSEKEIIRRRKAFLSLSISYWCGLILVSILFNFQIYFLFLGFFALILFLANLWLKIFFDKFLRIETYLSKEFLIRMKEKILIKDINKIKIKRTSKNTIREIYIYLNNGKSIFFNGLNNFEKFTDELLKLVDKKSIIKNINEPINFDSVFFYPILGLILSFGTVYLLKIMTNFNYQTLKIFLYASIIYVILLAIYFVASKPISKRY